MFDALSKYTHKDHFFFEPSDDLIEVCNAPTDKSGVYVVYALKNGRIELVYIGRSGKVKKDGSLFIRKSGLGGIKDRLVNGRQFGVARRKSWKSTMLFQKIEALDVYWYVTHTDTFVDCPRDVERSILNQYRDLYGSLPPWNKV